MKNILLPVLIGAAAGGAIAWFFTSDETDKLRENLLEKVSETFDSVKEKVVDRLNT